MNNENNFKIIVSSSILLSLSMKKHATPVYFGFYAELRAESPQQILLWLVYPWYSLLSSFSICLGERAVVVVWNLHLSVKWMKAFVAACVVVSSRASGLPYLSGIEYWSKRILSYYKNPFCKC